MNDGRILLVVFMAFWAVLPTKAVQLGETMEELVNETGVPTFEDHSKQTVQYRWDDWKLDIQFRNDQISSLTYTKVDALTEEDIHKILDGRADGNNWKPWVANGTTKRWLRSDFALAIFDSSRPRVMSLSGGKHRPATAAVLQPLRSAQEPILTPSFKQPQSTKSSTPLEQHSTGDRSDIGTVGLVVTAALVFCLKILSQSKPSKALSISTKEPPPTTATTALESLTWEQFELLVGEIYRRQGWEVKLCAGLGPDGGVDLDLRKEGIHTLVQCKHWRNQQVGVGQVREIFGVLVSEKADRAILITSGTFTQEALKFAANKSLELIDGRKLQELIQAVSEQGENISKIDSWLPQFRKLATFTIPKCPKCGIEMTKKTRRGRSFWGCRRYPVCRGLRDARTDFQC